MTKAVTESVRSAVALLKRRGSRATLAGLPRYSIPTDHAFGVPMREIQALAKRLGRDHDLALGLWETGWYEAKLLAAYVAEPARLTPAQMNSWVAGFDNWAVCDTVCFVLFDRTPHAWGRVEAWAGRRPELVKRAAFALLWALALHDRTSADDRFLRGLAIIEREAYDSRHYVQKAVNMALRAIGTRSTMLGAAALEVADRLASSPDRAAQATGRAARKAIAARMPRRARRDG